MDGFSVRVKEFFPPFYFATVFSFILLLILTAVYILHVPPVRLSVVTGLPMAGWSFFRFLIRRDYDVVDVIE